MEKTKESELSEMEELRARITELEHLVTLPTCIENTTTTMMSNSSRLYIGDVCGISNNNSAPGETGPTCLNISALMSGYNEMVERVSELETLLAASEIDSRNLSQELNQLKLTKTQLVYYHAEELKGKDCHISDLEHKNELLETELKRNIKKSETLTEYINTLPSEAELSEAKERIGDLWQENDLLKDKGNRMKGEISQLQRELIEKERLYQEALTKLETLKPLEEAEKSLLKENLLFSTSDLESSVDANACDVEGEIKKTLTVQRAQLLRSAKVIESLRQKLSQCDMERCLGVSKISDLTTAKTTLEQELNYSSCQIDKLNERLKVEEEKRRSLQESCTSLELQIQINEEANQIQQQQFGNFLRLVAELDLCVSEIRNLMEIAVKVGQGEELAVEDLVGLGNGDDAFNFQDDESQLRSQNSAELLGTSSVDLEWILKSLGRVTEFRTNISSIKVRLMDFYVELTGGKCEGCNVQ